MIRSILGSIVGAVLLATLASGAATAQTTVKFGYGPTSPIATFIVAQGIGAFEKEGLKLQIENGTESAVLLQMLAAGQVDLIGGGVPALMQIDSLGAKLKAVATFEYTFTDDDGYSAEAVYLIAPKDRNIKTLADLKGKRLATSGFSSAWTLALRSEVKTAGIDPKDVTFVVVPFPQMAGALLNKEVDAAVITSTEYVRTSQRIPVEVLMSGTQINHMKLDLTQVIIGRDDWMQKNQDSVVKFIKALYRARQFMQQDIAETGGKNLKEMIRTQTKFDDFLADNYFKYRAGYVGRELRFTNPLDIPKSTVDRYHEILTQGDLIAGKLPVDYANIVDLSYLKRALKEMDVPWDPAKADR
jgi:ABC-type nitrate/sulfonate/bicarbonate transport system substrate-binding protein